MCRSRKDAKDIYGFMVYMESYECYAFDVFVVIGLRAHFLDGLNIPLFALMDKCSFSLPLEFSLQLS